MPAEHWPAAVIGNDVSSRSIESENPLYLSQAKIWEGSCSLGPCIVPVGVICPSLGTLEITLSVERDSSEVFSGSVRVGRMVWSSPKSSSTGSSRRSLSPSE